MCVSGNEKNKNYHTAYVVYLYMEETTAALAAVPFTLSRGLEEGGVLLQVLVSYAEN